MTDTTRQLWDALITASEAARRTRNYGYRDGLLSAFAIVTGQDPETIHEEVSQALVARHEQYLADTDTTT